MTDLVVNRWNRYGKQRLYLNLLDGRRVGWVDLVTNERHLELAEFASDFDRILTAYSGDGAAGAAEDVQPVEPVTPPTPSAEIVTEPENRDLAHHRPGELARARAQAEWEAAKEDSTVLAWAAGSSMPRRTNAAGGLGHEARRPSVASSRS